MSPPLLITIGVSHYCEKARWALEYGGIAYDERAYPPILHYRALRGLGVGRTVPVLLDGETRLGDSTAILDWVDARLPTDRKLYPADPDLRREADALEDRFDVALGPATRRMAYAAGFQSRSTMVRLATQKVGWLDRVLVPLTLPVARSVISRRLGLAAPDIQNAIATCDAVLEHVEGLLADGRRYLVGDRFGAADLTYAALIAPAVVPRNYGAELPTLEALPPEFREWAQGIIDRPAGAFAQRLWAEHRDPS